MGIAVLRTQKRVAETHIRRIENEEFGYPFRENALKIIIKALGHGDLIVSLPSFGWTKMESRICFVIQPELSYFTFLISG